MADETKPIPLPPPGNIVTEDALYNTNITLYRNTMAFGGQRNPTDIWQSMLRGDGLAIPYYRELEEKDTDVANALDTLRLSVVKREHRVTPADQTSLAIDVADFIEEQLKGLPDFHSVLSNMLDATGYGFSVAEMEFDTSMGQASLLNIQDCPQELFLFGNRFYPQIGPLQFLTQPQLSSGTLVPEQKFLVYSHRMRSRDRMGRPLLRAVFWSSWFKRNMQRLWVRYAEKGPGTAVVRYPDAASSADRQQAANLAQRIIEEVAVGVPADFDIEVELLKGTRTMNPDVYEHFYEAMQLDVVRRILGETLTSFGAEKGRGAQALGTVHSETLDDKSVELAKALAGVVNRQLIKPLVLWNFGPNAPMPVWSFDTDEEKDLTERLAIDKGLQQMGVPMPMGYLLDTYQVPKLETGDIAAVPLAGAATSPDPTISPSFSERSTHPLAAQELREFDALERQLRNSAEELMKKRVVEVAHALTPGER